MYVINICIPQERDHERINSSSVTMSESMKMEQLLSPDAYDTCTINSRLQCWVRCFIVRYAATFPTDGIVT